MQRRLLRWRRCIAFCGAQQLKERLEEVVERAAHEAKYKALSVAALKDLLRANGALLGGAKDELVNRCVDHKMFGCLPRCPPSSGTSTSS